MDLLAHNALIRIHSESRVDFFRVLFDVECIGKVVAVRIDSTEPIVKLGGRPKRATALQRRPPLPLVGTLEWLDRDTLLTAASVDNAFVVETEPEAAYLQPLRAKDLALFERRCHAMQAFLNYELLRRSILSTGSVIGLITDAQAKGISKALAYKCFSLLCRFGFCERSLRPRRFRCGC